MSLAARVARNASWSVLGQVGGMAVSFVAIPRVVGRLGLEAYAVYVLLNAVSNYLSVLSFGAGPATVKYAAEHAARGEGKALRTVVAWSAVFHGLCVLAGAAAVAAAAPRLAAGVFQVPRGLLAVGATALACAAAGGVFASLTQMSLCVLQGLQRFDLHSLLAFASGAMIPGGAWAVLASGRGLRAVALWFVAANALSCAAAAATAWRAVRRVPLGAPGRAPTLREFAAFGAGMTLGPAASTIANQGDKTLIANRLPYADLTLYSIPSSILQRLQVLPAVLSSVLLPAVSELNARGDGEALSRAYLRSVRLLATALAPVLAALFCLMPQFLGLWVGAAFGSRSVWPARLLVLAQAFQLLNYVPNAVAIGCGRPWYLSAVSVGQAAVSLAAWGLLIPRFGILGAAAGALAAQAVPALAYLRAVHGRVLGLPARRFAVEALAAPALSGAAALALLLPLHHLADSWPRLALAAAAGVCAAAAVSWALAPSEDRELALRFLRLERRG
ncbi:MAG TPA: oligosaccharide flippase family protein [Elusimicrobiota bacterium]|nr:oligosaccharide flippase family protein [Elusimicrobiota bacterium]